MLVLISKGQAYKRQHLNRRAWSNTVAALQARGFLNDRWGFTDAPNHGLSEKGVAQVEILLRDGLPARTKSGPMSYRMQEDLIRVHDGQHAGAKSKTALLGRGLLEYDGAWRLTPEGVATVLRLKREREAWREKSKKLAAERIRGKESVE